MRALNRSLIVSGLIVVVATCGVFSWAVGATAQETRAPLEPADGVLFGAWPKQRASTLPLQIDAVSEFEALTGSSLDFVINYRPPHQNDLAVDVANHWLAQGKIPVITWRPGPEVSPEAGDNAGQAIVDGAYDDQIRQRAREARQIEGPWFSRLFNEMDGFLSDDYDLPPQLFVELWRHVYDIFEEEGVNNAVWLWNTANFDAPDAAYYPGDDVVDWIALNQFLFKGQQGAERCADEPYRTLDQKIGQDFWDFAAAHPDKPVMITEWGVGFSDNSAETFRQDFIASAHDVLVNHPQVKAMAYFNSNKSGGCEWDLTNGADPQTGVAAYSALVNEPAYDADVAALLQPWGTLGPAEVMHTVSCLAGNGRVNTNVVNTGGDAAVYRLEFEGLTARQTTVQAGDWWRMPVTGRADDDYELVVRRDGVEVSRKTVSVVCDEEVPVVDTDEIRVINSCRFGDGYFLFQFVNPTAQAKSWVIELLPAPNRSTTAQPYAQSLVALSGRPDGSHTIRFRVGGTWVEEHDVVVNCDP